MPRKYSASEKVKHVIASYSDGVVVTRYCDKHEIPRSSLYRWRGKFSNRFNPVGVSRMRVARTRAPHRKLDHPM